VRLQLDMYSIVTGMGVIGERERILVYTDTREHGCGDYEVKFTQQVRLLYEGIVVRGRVADAAA